MGFKVKFQENGYITEECVFNRILRLQMRYVIVASIMKHKGEALTLRHDGIWSDFGTDSSGGQFLLHFRIYTGDKDRFNWVNDKFAAACERAGYPFWGGVGNVD